MGEGIVEALLSFIADSVPLRYAIGVLGGADGRTRTDNLRFTKPLLCL